MKPNVSLRGKLAEIRLATNNDIKFLYDLRMGANTENTVHAIQSFDNHIKWFDNYLKKDDDLLFVINDLRDNQAKGTIALVDIDYKTGYAEIGRWLTYPGSKIGVEAILLAYRIAIEELKMKRIFARVMERNPGVIKFHKFVGLELTEPLGAEAVDGKLEKMIGLHFTVEMWPNIKSKLESMANVFSNN